MWDFQKVYTVSVLLASLVGISGFLTYRYQGSDRRLFMPGPTTHGHYQIELQCQACHDEGNGVREESCLECHGKDLAEGKDSHPMSKFRDPRNADRLKAVDALKCVSCHLEHRPDLTFSMGQTLPEDFCFHCHQTIAEERPSHAGLEYKTCQTAGCHNYHDNTALYEDYLAKHLDEPTTIPNGRVPLRRRDDPGTGASVLSPDGQNLLEGISASASSNVLEGWARSRHASHGVNCLDCHKEGETADSMQFEWSRCGECHEEEWDTFGKGKHGMRLAQGMSSMQPRWARAAMRSEVDLLELNCGICHGDHDFDTRRAAVESCLECHADTHSLAYRNSPHFKLWEKELSGEGPAGTGVSCATCHLPRLESDPAHGGGIQVMHNQNWNLQPNEKMVRSVCQDCHGLQFTLNALADPVLIKNNFSSAPEHTIPSLEWVRARITSGNVR